VPGVAARVAAAEAASDRIQNGGLMPKASITLPNGTVVEVDGTVEEVQRLLQFYGGSTGNLETEKRKRRKQNKRKTPASPARAGDGPKVNHAEIVNVIKTCDEADAIDRMILSRTSVVDRTLLPLYIVHEYLSNSIGLTSGDVHKITTDLGIPTGQANASSALSGSAKRYVIGDKIRVKGRAVRYKLSRAGLDYVKSVIKGKADDK
jgi:hypothetical protein